MSHANEYLRDCARCGKKLDLKETVYGVKGKLYCKNCLLNHGDEILQDN